MSVWHAKALDVGPFFLVYFLFSVDKRGWCIPLSTQLVACKWCIWRHWYRSKCVFQGCLLRFAAILFGR